MSQSPNKSFQYVPALAGLHRTGFPARCASKPAAELGVIAGASVILGLRCAQALVA